MKKSNIFALLTLMVLALPMHAVTRYKCDFENEADRNRWVLNPTASQSIDSKLKNRWYIDEPGNNSRTGHFGLFVSSDGGQTAEYTNEAGCWNYAYDTISLDPLASGDYNLSFDYCVMANVASDFDGLYLLWIPMTKASGQAIKVLSTPNGGSIPTGMDDYIIRLQPQANMDFLNGTATWLQCAVTIPSSLCDGTPHYLAFVWTNGSNLPQQPAAMVDNITIRDNTPCDVPTNLVVTPNGTTVSLTWDGDPNAEYEVSAYSNDAKTWAGPKIVTGTATSFSGLPIGQTDFIVRKKCDEDFYSLKTIESKLIYYPDQMCVNYLDLSNAKCYVHNPNNKPSNTLTYNDFQLVAPVDKGPASIGSRHTVHFDRTETEPRTGNMAKTIPTGELASVRLGNWDSDDEAERIEFSIDVDTIKYPVLLLKYLPIIEAPGHADTENPRFKLDMLINGVSIGRCGMADFNANDVLVGGSGNVKPQYAAQGWHKTPSSVAQTSADVVWKEWTTVGVNLRKPEYQGKRLTVQLTTHDCTFSVHSGYAYFTLGCSDGKLKDMKCGQVNPDFKAPDGFKYRWAYAYNEKYRNKITGVIPEQYVLGHDQTYYAGEHDDSLYVVDCMFVGDTTCYFSLYCSTLATNPITVMEKPSIIKNCVSEKYTVKFDGSKSWVQEIDHVTQDTFKNKNYHIESYEWNIEGLAHGWSDEPSPSFDFPITGGDYPYSLRTTCGTCEDIVYDTLHLAPLGPTYETRTMVLCDEDRKGAGFVWAEKPDTAYHDYGRDSIILFNEETSCDSIIYLELVEPKRVFVDTVVFTQDLPFTFKGRTYGEGTTSMIDTVPDPLIGCQLTYVLNLEIYEPLAAHMPNVDYKLCEGDPVLTLIYNITRGRSLRYSYHFDDPTMPSITPVTEMQKKGQYMLDVPLSATLMPNIYTGTLLLEDSLPEWNATIPFTLTMQYASSVIAQRWNDVLAIKNAEYNGGYTFDSIQWYVNGAPIDGAIDFVYYTGEGKQLQMGAEYSALLKRPDGVKLFTCAFIPAPVAADVKDMPSLVEPQKQIPMKGSGTAYWYDMLGRRHSSESYSDSSISAPAVAGYYLLVLQSDNTRSAHRILVK